jgi:hypothetical protein
MKHLRTLLFPVLFALALPGFASVNVSAPGNGASLTTPFNLAANASSCSSQPVSAMGYSLDNSSDTTVVNGASIDASVPAPTGSHTLHVKAWGNKGASCVTDVAIQVTGSAAASDGVIVDSPGNGSSVTSPFQVSANSTTCSGQPVAAMAYSIDNSANSAAVSQTALDVSVSAAAGTHILHVKSWGNNGAGCDADISVTVAGAASAGSNTSADGISVSSPGNGATVGSPFTLTASASTCSGQAVAAMGYSLDNSSATTVVRSTSVGASVSASAGTHTLHVKSWGNGGAGCVANLTIDVQSGSTTSGGPTSSSDGVSVSSPGNGSTVGSPFDVVAGSSSCSGQPVSAMAYSLDSGADLDTVNATSLNASASASAGAHTVHVKSWGNKGAGCVANIAINVGGSSGGSSAGGPGIPSYATSVSSLQTLGSWKESYDNATSGSASGSMALVGSPAISGNSRQFVTGFSTGGGERYYVSFGDDTSAQNFVYDAWVYLTSSAGSMANLELDMNQVMANGQTIIYGFQCDGYAGVWDYTKNSGSASGYNDTWVRSSQPCNVRNWARNAWHHVQISYSRNSSGYVTYNTVWLDGKAQPINATVYSAFALGWAPTLVANFQVDGLGSGSTTVYLDKFTVYRW